MKTPVTANVYRYISQDLCTCLRVYMKTCKPSMKNLVHIFENVILFTRKFTAAAGHSDIQKSILLVLAKDL